MSYLDIVNKTICFSAKRGSGKSRLLRFILKRNKDEFDAIFIICPTEPVNKFYDGILPSSNIFDCYNEKWVEDIIKKMTLVNSNKSFEEQKHIMIIFDDCCSDESFSTRKKYPNFYKLFTRGRHLNISVMITSQYLHQLPPIIRNNCDYLLVGQNNAQGIEILTKDFRAGTISKKDFVKLYYANTSDYKFLLINNNTSSSNENLNEIYGVLKTPEEFIK